MFDIKKCKANNGRAWKIDGESHLGEEVKVLAFGPARNPADNYGCKMPENYRVPVQFLSDDTWGRVQVKNLSNEPPREQELSLSEVEKMRRHIFHKAAIEIDALTKLAIGGEGSTYFYYKDAYEAGIKHIRFLRDEQKRLQEANEMLRRSNDNYARSQSAYVAVAERDAERIDKLKAALKPFADVADDTDRGWTTVLGPGRYETARTVLRECQ